MFLVLSSFTGVQAPEVPVSSDQDLEEVSIVREVEDSGVEEKDYSSVEEFVKDYFSDVPIMAEVARCESTFRHYDKNGNVLRGVVNKSDVGVMQINEYYHLEKSKKLGLDIHTIEDNLEYARYLYENQGLQPWRASSRCWAGNQEFSIAVRTE